MTRNAILLAAMAAIALAACTKAPPTPEPIVDAERAFSADGYDNGVKASFLRYATADAIMLAPGPVNAHEFLGARPDLDPAKPGPHLVWWPLWAGVAKSGDLGFTTGPYAIDADRAGEYFTVWQLQDDGSWKWVLDAGVGADASGEAAQGSPVGYLATASVGSSSPDAAMTEVAAEESALADIAARDLAGAYRGRLAPQARLHDDGRAPATTPAEADAALSARPSAMTFSFIQGGASAAGDLAWTLGDTTWTTAEGEHHGVYARIWQKRAEGWRIVFDEIVP